MYKREDIYSTVRTSTFDVGMHVLHGVKTDLGPVTKVSLPRYAVHMVYGALRTVAGTCMRRQSKDRTCAQTVEDWSKFTCMLQEQSPYSLQHVARMGAVQQTAAW